MYRVQRWNGLRLLVLFFAKKCTSSLHSTAAAVLRQPVGRVRGEGGGRRTFSASKSVSWFCGTQGDGLMGKGVLYRNRQQKKSLRISSEADFLFYSATCSDSRQHAHCVANVGLIFFVSKFYAKFISNPVISLRTSATLSFSTPSIRAFSWWQKSL